MNIENFQSELNRLLPVETSKYWTEVSKAQRIEIHKLFADLRAELLRLEDLNKPETENNNWAENFNL